MQRGGREWSPHRFGADVTVRIPSLTYFDRRALSAYLVYRSENTFVGLVNRPRILHSARSWPLSRDIKTNVGVLDAIRALAGFRLAAWTTHSNLGGAHRSSVGMPTV
jgi:hypothetical protein